MYHYNIRLELNNLIDELNKLQGGKLLYHLFKSAASPSEHREISQIEGILGPHFDPLANIRPRFVAWSIQVDLYVEQFRKNATIRSFISAKGRVQRMFDAKKPNIEQITRSLNQLGLQLDGIASIANTLAKPEKPQRPVNQDKKKGEMMIAPSTPFSNKIAFWDTIKSCDGHIHWVDKYFSVAGLRMLSEALDGESVKTVKILMSIDKADEKIRKAFKDFKDEMKGKGVACELRVIADSVLKASIHDRWIVSRGKCFNVPSPDTIERGQFSEIKATSNTPPFSQWWERGLDIIEKWNDVQKAKTGYA